MVTLGQAHETAITLEKAGATTGFWTRLAQNFQLAKVVVALVMNTTFRLISKIERDMTNWQCLEPVNAEGDFEPSVHEFLAEGENCCGGEEMIKRAKEKGISSGLRHLEAMLREQEKIPVEWRNFVLVSTEVWRRSRGDRDVWCLYWDGERWALGCIWLNDLNDDFSSRYRLVSSCKCQNKS
jgi:hypothetical protein